MSNYNEQIKISKSRDYQVVKANELIQRTRYSLSIQEQKSLAYVISMIKPTDTVLQEYEFDVQHFCKVCEIDYNNGKNYQNVKKTLKSLRDKSFWVELEDGTETLCSWVNKVWCDKRSGKARIRLDDDLAKYLIGLSEQFTQYELINTLPMKSQYSFRIYELMKSYSFARQKIFDLEDLKKRLMAETYDRYFDFRRKVLDVAMDEINRYTDLEVSYEPLKQGKKVTEIMFFIKKRDSYEKWEANNRGIEDMTGMSRKERISGQMNLYDFMDDSE